MRPFQNLKEKQTRESGDLPGYPEYDRDEDMYTQGRLEEEIDPENTAKTKHSDIEDDSFEDDLDIPGAELDDDLEDIGEEDEENNYYSLSDNDDLEDLI